MLFKKFFFPTVYCKIMSLCGLHITYYVELIMTTIKISLHYMRFTHQDNVVILLFKIRVLSVNSIYSLSINIIQYCIYCVKITV